MTDRLICPECGEELLVHEEWVLVNRERLGEKAGSTEEMQGDYAHAGCL